ncbi:uncharacterized protein BDR25DRAFT_315715 [Lindgomyces ingoldianus]|uniref:Uncharacterized protein n=1 Tax=Lindgomyces ingoldianus TaxID=673940 RepID=A0ACB6QRM4_9PLEO|nr:uncharacterized protein BDR25DRAFT_315715 [Lindgomyces ingoldianus]KAF2468727.1 hypothetical protein BDR25DRAFT_315715 [Lindgomyces ingoldianus]
MAFLTTGLLETPLHSSTQNTIIDSFWGPVPILHRRSLDGIDLEAYWSFYFKECEHALHDGGRHVTARTHQDILDIVALLRDHESRDDIRDSLRSKLSRTYLNEGDLLDSSIDLAARLLLMIDFGNLQYGFSGRRQLRWDKGRLKDYLKSYFGTPPALGHDRVKLERVFNACNLGRIAGVELIPTDNLIDHLRLTDDDTKVYIFHHASFLKCQSRSTIMPDGLADETLRTLALLFPQSDPHTRKWFRQLPPPFLLDPQLIQCGHLKTDDRQIEHFVFWHDRLVILKQIFDEATPRHISQWWYDRRNGVQWYTFWVAIMVLGLTLLFGLVQCIEGAMQVYGTFHPKQS